MTELISAVLAVIILICGFQMLSFSAGITKTHPMTFIGKLIGGLVVAVLRAPLILFGGIASGVFRRKGRKRRRLN